MTSFPLHRILHATDFSTPARAALVYAVDLARRCECDLHVLHVTSEEPDEAKRERLRETVEAARQMLPPGASLPPIATELIEESHAVDAIVAHAAKDGVDLIVLGTHGHRGLRHLFLGSVTERVVRKAPCPVLVVREAPESLPLTIRRLVVPIDFSPASREALIRAKALAARYEASVALVFVAEEHVVPFFSDTGLPTFSVTKVDEDITARAGEALRQLNSEAGSPDVPADFHVRRGTPVDEIIALAREENADLIAMATHGFTGLERGLLGSVTERVVRLAPCPVWMANPEALGVDTSDWLNEEAP